MTTHPQCTGQCCTSIAKFMGYVFVREPSGKGLAFVEPSALMATWQLCLGPRSLSRDGAYKVMHTACSRSRAICHSVLAHLLPCLGDKQWEKTISWRTVCDQHNWCRVVGPKNGAMSAKRVLIKCSGFTVANHFMPDRGTYLQLPTILCRTAGPMDDRQVATPAKLHLYCTFWSTVLLFLHQSVETKGTSFDCIVWTHVVAWMLLITIWVQHVVQTSTM